MQVEADADVANININMDIICGSLCRRLPPAYVLTYFSYLDVHIYESADIFRETAIAICIPRSARATLKLAGSPAAIEQASQGRAEAWGPGIRDGEDMTSESHDTVQGQRLVNMMDRGRLAS